MVDQAGRSDGSRGSLATVKGRQIRSRLRDVFAADDGGAGRVDRAPAARAAVSGHPGHLRRHAQGDSCRGQWRCRFGQCFRAIERWTIGRAARVNLVSQGFDVVLRRAVSEALVHVLHERDRRGISARCRLSGSARRQADCRDVRREHGAGSRSTPNCSGSRQASRMARRDSGSWAMADDGRNSSRRLRTRA